MAIWCRRPTSEFWVEEDAKRERIATKPRRSSIPIGSVVSTVCWWGIWLGFLPHFGFGRAHSLRDANNKLKPKMKTTTHENKYLSASREKQHIQIILDDDDFSFSYFSRSLEFVRCTFALLLCVLLGPPRAHIYTACSGFEIIKQFSIFFLSSLLLASLCSVVIFRHLGYLTLALPPHSWRLNYCALLIFTSRMPLLCI